MSSQRSVPGLDACVTFEADAVRVGRTRVPCHAAQGSVVVLGDSLRPLTLGERALAVSLGARDLARTVWELSGGNASLARSVEHQAVVESVALHLAGAANRTGLHRALAVAGRSLGDAATVQALRASIADDLADDLTESRGAGTSEGPDDAGWTVLRIGAPVAPGGADLHDPVSVRAALVAALLERAARPVPPELADVTTAAVAPVAAEDLAGRAPARAGSGQPGSGQPSAPLGNSAGQDPDAAGPPPVGGRPSAAQQSRAHHPLETPARVPSRFPSRSPSVGAEPRHSDPVVTRIAGTGVSTIGVAPRPAPHHGAGWGVARTGTGAPSHPVFAGFDWRSLPTLGWLATAGPASDGAGPSASAGARRAGDAWAARRAGAPTEGPADVVPDVVAEVAEQLLAVADRRGLA